MRFKRPPALPCILARTYQSPFVTSVCIPLLPELRGVHLSRIYHGGNVPMWTGTRICSLVHAPWHQRSWENCGRSSVTPEKGGLRRGRPFHKWNSSKIKNFCRVATTLAVVKQSDRLSVHVVQRRMNAWTAVTKFEQKSRFKVQKIHSSVAEPSEDVGVGGWIWWVMASESFNSPPWQRWELQARRPWGRLRAMPGKQRWWWRFLIWRAAHGGGWNCPQEHLPTRHVGVLDRTRTH